MKLIIVGGFLGAGKTTLLWESAKRLALQNEKVGLITNDQVPDLVDTAILSRSGCDVREVAGSCFCCNFDGLIGAVESLAQSGAETIIAEPVGSCTDLSATILQPLKQFFPAIQLAPLSVLVDPNRIRDIFGSNASDLHPDAAYIIRVQLEEADQILLNKSDTLSKADCKSTTQFLHREFPHSKVTAISALTGEGIDTWLRNAVAGGVAGARVPYVDYDRYAHGEAVLGWLNASVNLRWTASLEPAWQELVSHFTESLREALRKRSSSIGHLKLLLQTSSGCIFSNITAIDAPTHTRSEGSLARLASTLAINARVQISPGALETLIRESLRDACHSRAAATFKSLHCIVPGRPQPTHRYNAPIPSMPMRSEK